MENTKINKAQLTDGDAKDLNLKAMYQLLDLHMRLDADVSDIQAMIDSMEAQNQDIINTIHDHIDPDNHHGYCFYDSDVLDDYGVSDIIKVMRRAAIQYLNTLTKRQLEAYHQYVCTSDKGREYFAKIESS
jgi:hypothetical protein